MSLDHILLGILDEPQSGYSLKQTFDNVFSHFWTAEISQIYRNLKSLERRGLLECQEEVSDRGPSRKLYRRTSAGIEELRTWIEAGPELADRRVPYLAQTFFLSELPDESARVGFFEQLREHFEARLRVLEDIDAEVRKEHEELFSDGLPAQEISGRLVINHGLHRLRAMLDWCDESLEILKRGEGQTPGDLASDPAAPTPAARRNSPDEQPN